MFMGWVKYAKPFSSQGLSYLLSSANNLIDGDASGLYNWAKVIAYHVRTGKLLLPKAYLLS